MVENEEAGPLPEVNSWEKASLECSLLSHAHAQVS